jgi:hypothetical protein
LSSSLAAGVGGGSDNLPNFLVVLVVVGSRYCMVVGGGGPPRAGGLPAAASSFLPAIFRLSRLFHRRAAALATLSFPPFPIVAKFSPLLTIGIAKPPLPLPLQYLYLDN